jgi:hypothetical protein
MGEKIMEAKLQKSIDRASALLKTPPDYEKYISIKLYPPSGCCCSDCWPETWQTVNQSIYPCGPITHEGDALIEKDGNIFVLEQHESGPEILVYLALATASATLAKSVIDLITTIIKGLSTEHRKQPPRIKIVKRRLIKGNIEEEKLIEIDIPVSNKIEKQLEEKIKQALNKNP